MSPEFTIRRYRPADHERVLALHEEAMRQVGSFVEGAPDADLAKIESSYLDSGGEFLVGEVDGRLVAMGAFRPADGYVTEFLDDLRDGAAELKRMRVDPAHQRQGYGSQLLDALERRARAQGYTELVLDTSPKQEGAQRLYESHEFEQVRREEAQLAEEAFVLLFYRKSLA
ncbi:GNAT family N-acetyltransferase [Haloarchaeobius sp. HME9146]|uniref:GNAT family N-acetyltransferase n=1 Tax=Haloarchaeobius sp. HME9146 TaxID=2978732 RepID=UPI0021C01277|nr:GNAT family N-acetyltransferase [Haloarchaeobius sp. HME9146]MCT9094714.1 GNAT family N-acetyltransferase [Haloarchaeobius sp. HME9146]